MLWLKIPKQCGRMKTWIPKKGGKMLEKLRNEKDTFIKIGKKAYRIRS